MSGRIEAARRRLCEALLAGRDTTLLRRAIAQLEAADAAAHARQSAAGDAETNDRVTEVAARAEVLTAQIHQAARDAANTFLESKP